jgi:hypothetical protein
MDERTRLTDATGETIVIALVVHQAAEPIAGTVTLRHGPSRPFTGWMQMTQRLARALDQPT